MTVVGAADEHRVLARVDQPVAQREGGAGVAGAAQDREAGPAQPQAEGVGELAARVFRTGMGGYFTLLPAVGYSYRTSCGVRYPSVEWRRVLSSRSSIHRAISSVAALRLL